MTATTKPLAELWFIYAKLKPTKKALRMQENFLQCFQSQSILDERKKKELSNLISNEEKMVSTRRRQKAIIKE